MDSEDNKKHMEHKEETHAKVIPQESYKSEWHHLIISLSKLYGGSAGFFPSTRFSKLSSLQMIFHTINNLCH